MCEVIARIKKSRLAEIRVTRDQYQGREVVDIRVWVQELSGAWKPSTKGCSSTRSGWMQFSPG